MNLDYIETFLVVARTGSFRTAAKQLNISQPSVSQHIKKLESIFGSELFIRSHSGNRLTPAAQKLLPYAESLIRTFDHAKIALTEERLWLGASSNIGIYILQPYIRRFINQFQSPLKYDLTIDTNPAIAQKLETAEIDCAVMEWWDNRDGFAVWTWRHEELVLIVPPEHPWKSLPVISKQALQHVEMLGGERGTGTGRLLEQHFGKQVQSMKVMMNLGSTEAVKQAVQAGLGISIVLAESVRQEVADGSIHAIPIDLGGVPLQKELFVICRQHLSPESSAMRFVNMLLHDVPRHTTASTTISPHIRPNRTR